MKKRTTTLDNRMAVLLARADCRDNPAALAACDLFLAYYPAEKCAPHFLEMSDPERTKPDAPQKD